MKHLAILISGISFGWSVIAGNVQVLSISGQVERERAGVYTPLERGQLASLDGLSLRTGKQSLAQLRLDDGSIVVLPPDSAVQLGEVSGAVVGLTYGGVNVLPAQGYLAVRAQGQLLKTNGYLRLRQCAAACKEAPGLYGKALSGEVIIEYAGGRAVLRNKSFLVASRAGRPMTLARDVDVLADDARLESAQKAKIALAEDLRLAMNAYKEAQYEDARRRLQQVLEQSPTEKIVPYYLGLIALELKDNDGAVKHLQQYARVDPETARERGVNELLTLLLTNQLQAEVTQALSNEKNLSSEKPEPNSVAVQAFTNRGDPGYSALAKGIAAMVITDLSKVPGLKVLERQKVQKLLDEIQLNASGLTSEDDRVRAGRLMKAEKVVVGTFGVQ